MRKAINHLKRADPVMAEVIRRVGPYRIVFRDPDFGTLVRSIVYQQLSGKVAAVILGRLLTACRGKLTPKRILALPVEEMRGLGLSGAKTVYIRDLAERTLTKEVRFDRIAGLGDEAVIEHLTQVKGIGVWTAHMFLMFALRRPDVLPTGDLGVRSAIKKAYGLEALPSPKQIEEMAQAWRPYCSVATWYLWRSLEGPADLK